jgi:hypothetical protein
MRRSVRTLSYCYNFNIIWELEINSCALNICQLHKYSVEHHIAEPRSQEQGADNM